MKHPFLKVILPILGLYLGIQVFYFLVYTPLNFILPITWDKFGYYLYLPATFIYHDLLHVGFAEACMRKYELSSFFYQAHLHSNGNYVLSYTLGLALLELPFFCLGHLAAHLLHYPADGFSLPYQFCLTLGGTCYAMLGLWFTYLNLKNYFSNAISLLVLVIIILGTNYFYYSAFDNGMTHSYLFSLYAIVIHYIISWHKQQKLRYAIILGAAIGLAIVIRPSEIVIILIPLLWNITDVPSLVNKYKLVLNRYMHFVALLLVTALIGFIQIIYWKYSSGQYLYNSYKVTGQFFDFTRPHLLQGIFSISRGWFTYTPVMLLCVPGLVLLYRHHRPILFAISSYLFINIYVVFSWWSWDYGGGFGCRPLVQSYAVLALPIGFALDYLLAKKNLRYLTLFFVNICILLNLFQTTQFVKGMLSVGGLSLYTYSLVFGKLSISMDDIKAYQKLDRISGAVASVDTLSPQAAEKYILTKPMLIPHQDTLIYFCSDMAPADSYLRFSAKGIFNFLSYSYRKQAVVEIDFADAAHKKIKSKTAKIEPLIWDAAKPLNADCLGDPLHWHRFDFLVKIPPLTRYIRLSEYNAGINVVLIDSILLEQVIVRQIY